MDKATRTSATDSRHGHALLTAKAVLARLPDVTAEAELQRAVLKTSASSVGYRFDPPQSSHQGSTAGGELRSRSATLKSELIYSPRSRRTHQPHAFGRERASLRQTRRESPILPHSNPFENPQRQLLDSVAPVVRFITLVVLFTAVGIWFQMMNQHSSPPPKSIDPPTTTVDERVAPATKTAERPIGGATSSGPVGTTPESNRRVGRAREDHDFARLRGDILSAPATAYGLEVVTKDTSGRGNGLPQLQIVELPKTSFGAGDGPARSINARLNVHEEAAIREAARFDGFFDKIPWR